MSVKNAVILALLLLLAWREWAGPAPLHTVERVEVPVEVIIEAEPRVELRYIDRIVWRTSPPVQIAIATGGGAEDVAAFCPELVTQEGEEPAPPTLLLRSSVHHPGRFLRSGRVDLVGPTSHGDLIRGTYSVRDGWTSRVSGDSILVRSPRFGLVKDIGEAAVWTGLGYLLGRTLHGRAATNYYQGEF